MIKPWLNFDMNPWCNSPQNSGGGITGGHNGLRDIVPHIGPNFHVSYVLVLDILAQKKEFLDMLESTK